ncbi:biotin/lipoyl-containing protein [Tunicatimonas pelagia]|uniref:biotin/lipoyl-containing protein n=1 Tax=Tunicatimonas pelagia TaxID=931531 RepID=UPI0026664E34|nr:acetyl-CoA carboxylase biotin carboxyl carrier protein subunit [Tunicatimonas pelagia]WKN42234.1 biotin/lipoyl-binding protein [Tunicatimonas pelagia]
MYQASVDDNTSLSVEVKDDQIHIDQKKVDLDIHQISPNQFHVLYQHRSYQIEVLQADYATKQFIISVNGKRVPVQLQSELDQLLETLGMDATSEAVVEEVRSPMPGLIRAVEVNAGDSVQTGDKLLTLEAMKMENVIKSPASGMIDSVLVKTGESVEKNQVLVSFEVEGLKG